MEFPSQCNLNSDGKTVEGNEAEVNHNFRKITNKSDSS